MWKLNIYIYTNIIPIIFISPTLSKETTGVTTKQDNVQDLQLAHVSTNAIYCIVMEEMTG